MNLVVIFLLTIAALFVLNFVTKRRFGALALALAAGTMLSSIWVGNVTPFVENAGVSEHIAPLQNIVGAIIILLPAVLLIVFGGPTYKGKFTRFMGALFFAILAATLLLKPLGSALLDTNVNMSVYNFLVSQRTFILSTGLIIGILDLLATKTPKVHHPRHYSHHERD